jgi:hypothetical protein
MVYGLWFMVYGLWFMVYGLWFMVYGLWFMVYGLGPKPLAFPFNFNLYRYSGGASLLGGGGGGGSRVHFVALVLASPEVQVPTVGGACTSQIHPVGP